MPTRGSPDQSSTSATPLVTPSTETGGGAFSQTMNYSLTNSKQQYLLRKSQNILKLECKFVFFFFQLILQRT